jgi:hypothetical protein
VASHGAGANGGIVAFNKEGEAVQSEKVLTFSRLYRELPYPPGDTVWVQDNLVVWVSNWEDSEEGIVLEGHTSKGDTFRKKLLDFYTEYNPMTFTTTSVHTTKGFPLASGEVWKGGDRVVTIFDIGLFRDHEFIRIQGDIEGLPTYEHPAGTMAVVPFVEFMESFDPDLPPCPCSVGDRWEDPRLNKDFTVQSIDEKNRGVLLAPFGLEDWEDQAFEVTYDDISEGYRKVEVKTAWEFLQED